MWVSYYLSIITKDWDTWLNFITPFDNILHTISTFLSPCNIHNVSFVLSLCFNRSKSVVYDGEISTYDTLHCWAGGEEQFKPRTTTTKHRSIVL